MVDHISIHKSPKKAWITIIAGVIILALAYIFFTAANDEVFGWIFIITAVFVLIFGIVNLLDRKPQIMITDEELIDYQLIKEPMAWETIVGIQDFFFRGQDFVRILLPTTYKPESIRPTLFWRFNRMYEQQGLKAVYIRVSGLEVNSKQLTTIIQTMTQSDPIQRKAFIQYLKAKF